MLLFVYTPQFCRVLKEWNSFIHKVKQTKKFAKLHIIPTAATTRSALEVFVVEQEPLVFTNNKQCCSPTGRP